MKNIKKGISIILVAAMLVAMSGISVVYSQYYSDVEETEVFTLSIGQNIANVFGEVKESDVGPIIRNDRTMLPARFVAENLGAEVLWDGENRVVTVRDDSIEIKLTIDSAIAVVNGVEETLDSPAFIENGRTYTPVRFIAEKLGSTVEWDGATQKVIMSRPVKTTNTATGTLELKNFRYTYEADDGIVEVNEGAIGGMCLSAELIGPSNVQEVLIAQWGEEPFLQEEIDDIIVSMIEIWKNEGLEVITSDVPFEFSTTHPVDVGDLGKKMYVLLIGVDENFDAVGYAVVEEVIGE